jgi:hypothetical protein
MRAVASTAYGVIGTGRIRTIVGTNPAAGVEITETVPAGKRWALRSLRVTLVTSGAVANRVPALFYDDGVSVFGSSVFNGSMAATVTKILTWGMGMAFVNPGGTSEVNLIAPLVLLLPGGRIRTSTSALDAGDDYGAPIYEVEEWDQ